MQLLQAPAFLFETRGEVIEQLGVARWLGHGAKVVRRGDESFAEMMQPDTVHHHSRCERIALAGNRPGQIEPAAAIGKGGPNFAREDFEEVARSQWAFVAGITANENRRILRL